MLPVEAFDSILCRGRPVTKDEAIQLLKTDVWEWNRRRMNDEVRLDLSGADLSGADLSYAALRGAVLSGADLSGANLSDAYLRGAVLSGANLSHANLRDADLSGANLSYAVLKYADLSGANLSDANLSYANLLGTRLSGANLSEANLSGAVLSEANLSKANFSGADLSGATLSYAVLNYADLSGAKLSDAVLLGTVLLGADLSEANLSGAILRHAFLSQAVLLDAVLRGTRIAWSAFGNIDLSVAVDLDTVKFHGPCTIGVDTLTESKGRIPDSFLRGCGFQKWQILDAKLYDPSLTAREIEELQILIFNERTAGDAFIGGTFISYAHANAKFVDKLYDRLTAKDIPTWLDRHDLVAGPIQKQVDRAIRLNDIVLLVLSKDSIESDWVKHELKTARRKEREQKREILCPIALDDAWKTKVLGANGATDVDWEHLGEKNVVDFSKWKTKAFDAAFKKLIDGLKLWYGRAPKASP